MIFTWFSLVVAKFFLVIDNAEGSHYNALVIIVLVKVNRTSLYVIFV